MLQTRDCLGEVLHPWVRLCGSAKQQRRQHPTPLRLRAALALRSSFNRATLLARNKGQGTFRALSQRHPLLGHPACNRRGLQRPPCNAIPSSSRISGQQQQQQQPRITSTQLLSIGLPPLVHSTNSRSRTMHKRPLPSGRGRKGLAQEHQQLLLAHE